MGCEEGRNESIGTHGRHGAGGRAAFASRLCSARVAFNLRSDYGIVSVPRAAVEAVWTAAASIAPVRLALDVPLSLGQLAAETSDPHRNPMFYAVGYGFTERLNFGSNAGGPRLSCIRLQIRRTTTMEPASAIRAGRSTFRLQTVP